MDHTEPVEVRIQQGPVPAGMLQSLGRLTVAFQHMEAGLAHMIWRVADIGGETAAIVTSGLTMRALQEKVSSLLRHHWAAVWQERGDALLRRVEKRTAERNTLVHSLWYSSDTTEAAVRFKSAVRGDRLKQGFTAVGVSEVERLADDIDEVAGQLAALGNELYPNFAQRHLLAKPPHSAQCPR